MKRSAALITTLLMGVLLALVPTAASAHARPYCGITWGSLAKTAAPATSTGELVNVRAGQHACYDRLVLDVRGDVSGYTVRYVNHVHADGSGAIVPVRGGAAIQIDAVVPSYDDQHNATYPIDRRELVDVTGFRTFRQVAGAGSFEGQTAIGLGVRAHLPFRVFTLDGPCDGSRLVIDVAHHWS